MNTTSEQVTEHTLSMQVLACLMASPQHRARKYIEALTPSDFYNPLCGRIFEAIAQATIPDIPNPSVVITQVNSWLLEQGDYKDTDTGIRLLVSELATQQACDVLLPQLVQQLVETAFRRAIYNRAQMLADCAHNAPLREIETTIEKLNKTNGTLSVRKNLLTAACQGIEQVA